MVACRAPFWDYHGTMSELHVRNIHPELHQLLRELADIEGRSMSAQAIALLRQALQPAADQSARQQAIDRLREIRNRSHLPDGAAPSEQLIREDRETAR
ncbi:hypothetical protein BH20ACT22_BH20ACT22_25320 [soil metagenome]